jgi:head-tail adaptor
MKLTNMTERITFFSLKPGVTNGVPTNNVKNDEFTCWAEVAKLPYREFVNNSTEVGYRKETPVFIISFKQKKEIQTNWRIRWRNQEYEIISMDPDYKTKDTNQIAGRVIHS